MDDLKLLKEYATRNSQEAFATLVQRHIGMVYSSALRQLRDPHLAEEITQVVFIILAKKSGDLRENTILSGWLYRTTRFACADALKKLQRRQRREQEAYMQSTVENPGADTTWQEIESHLDDALTQLGETDRNALVLRFFENRNLREVGLGLGVSEVAAQKRIARALEKLRGLLLKRETVLPVSVLIASLSANAAQAAPVGLAATVATTAAVKGAVAGASTLTLIKGTLKIMAWTKLKTAIVVGTGMLLAAGTTTVMLKEISSDEVDDKWFELSGTVLGNAPDNLKIIRPTHFGKPGMGSGMVGKTERIVCQNQPLEWGLVFANNFSSSSLTRLVLPEGFPKDNFDYLITLPQNPNDSGQDGIRSVMRDVIKKKFGFLAHRETRERDVLLLRVKNPNAAGLQKTVHDSLEGTAIQSSVEGLNSRNIPMYGLAANLEEQLGMPVRDETGITNRLAIDLRWKKLPGETTADTTKRVLLDQLGFELVPSRERIEILIVEKTGN